MPKPKNKIELIKFSQSNFEQLIAQIDSIPKEKRNQEFPPGTMNRNIRDVLAHLHHWHLMFLGWYEIGMQGKKPPMPAKGYTWKMMPELNQKIWSDYQEVPLETIQKALIESFQKIQLIMEQHTEEELFTKKKYAWTGITSLGVYLISNTSSHYEWGIKQLKKAIKSNR